MRKMALLAIATAVLLASLSYAATTGPAYITAGSALDDWLPIVSIAIVLSISLTAAYYMAGVMLNSNRIKAGAIGELGQAVGAAIIMVAVLATVAFFETGQLSFISVLSPGSMSTLCGQLGSSSVTLLNSESTINGAPTLTNAVCLQISDLLSGSTDLTQRIDYGLLANYVIMANVTNQAANNLNSLYTFESWIGFLSLFTMKTEVCSPLCGTGLDVGVNVTNRPLSGYDRLPVFTQPMEFEANLTFYILFVQLLIISLFLFAWPYLIAAGMVLRATFFTRRLGGLLIAIGVVVILIYPLMCILEYSAFSNSRLSPIGNGIAVNSLTNMALHEKLPDGTDTVYGTNGMNLFILPNAGELINYYSCGPIGGSVVVGEGLFADTYLIPGVGLGTALLSSAGGLVGALPVVPALEIGQLAGSGCTPDNALSTMMALVNMYGMVSVMGVFLPVINLLIAIAAAASLSKLFGGDTDILGLSKLI